VEGGELAPLPFARREAALITHAAEDRCWVGGEASESRLREASLDDYAVIHFATHALADAMQPQRSAIVLASGGDDGLLEASELSTLELDGKLVVLSACSSATGRQLTGEGVMGLAHALFEGGAATVVGSLWPVRDDEAFELVSRLYRHLDRGLSVAAAMTLAQRELAAAGRPSSAWVPMVVLGDGALVPFPTGRSAPRTDASEPSGAPVCLILLVSALVLSAGLYGVLSRRRRASDD
jgi:CHAT domain-containing protein